MQITYLILCHHRPTQLARLVQRLSGDDSRVLVHVDATSTLRDFEVALSGAGNNVSILKDRVDVRWGGWSIVEAELRCLRRAVEGHSSDYYVLLSGVDYPIRSERELKEELSSGAVYMEAFEMPDLEHHKPMSRLEQFYFAPKNRGGRLASQLNNRILPRLPKRNVAKGLLGHKPWGGAQWWALPRTAAEDLLQYTRNEPGIVRFFRRSRIPDEMFFQTLIHALPSEWEIRPPLTYADWERPEAGKPATMLSQDLDRLRERREFFARKFDIEVDARIFDLIDAEMLLDYPRL